MSEFAKAAWGDAMMAKTPESSGPSRIDRGDVKVAKEYESAVLRRRIAAVLGVEDKLATKSRVREYRKVVDDLIDGRVATGASDEAIYGIWEADWDSMLRGGGLSDGKILQVCDRLVNEGVITQKEALSLVDLAREEHNDQKNQAASSQWEESVAHVAARIGVNNRRIASKDPEQTIQIIRRGARLEAKDRGMEIVHLLNDNNFRIEMVSQLKKIIGRNPGADALANDIYQQTVLSLLEKRDDIDWSTIKNIRNYVLVILKNNLISYHRKSKHFVSVEDESVLDAMSNHNIYVENADDVQSLSRRLELDGINRLVAYIRGDIDQVDGKKFGCSNIKIKPEMLQRYRVVLEGKLTGETSIEIARSIAAVDLEFREKYAKALVAVEDGDIKGVSFKNKQNLSGNERRIQDDVVKMNNLVDAYYVRGMKLLRQDLGDNVIELKQ